MHDRPGQPGDTDDSPTMPFDMLEAIDLIDRVVVTDLDMDDLPTLQEVVDLDVLPDTPSSPAPDLNSGELLSTSLPISAPAAYEAFCDVESIPRWLSVVHSARILSRTPAGRPLRAAFVGRLQNGTIGYTLSYKYDEAQRSVSWGTAPGLQTLIAGRARFIPLGERATLMQYQLALELPAHTLPPGGNPDVTRLATTVVMNEFREYVIRRAPGPD